MTKQPISAEQHSGEQQLDERQIGGYDFRKRDRYWAKKWVDDKTYAAESGRPRGENEYVLDMFPYPSGSGLHVGHPMGYTGSDIYARMRRMQGKNVLHPMGWDAFGLPAERYAVKTNKHPSEAVARAVKSFRGVMQRLGLSYDWDREINTTDPDYYKWTQWIFLKLHERGLAYVDEVPVNWCPRMGTVLANEEVIDGKSERGGYPVEQRKLKQWVLKITEYAQRLIDDLDLVDWPEGVKLMQRNWIGRSEGLQIAFPVQGAEGSATGSAADSVIEAYTTRPETLAGVTYVVLAPEHPLVERLTTDAQRDAVRAYSDAARNKTEFDRTVETEGKKKTGVFTGAYVINPLNNKPVQVWVGDYVLGHYGTGAVMGVPDADQRDKDFAAEYGIDSIPIFPHGVTEDPDTGVLMNSGFMDGMTAEDARAAIMTFAEEKGFGVKKINYKLRDWVFSRQRYWGEPFPIVHHPDGTVGVLDASELPLELPVLDNYKPALDADPSAVLDRATDWVNLPDGGRRETNTMPNWAGSCWYYLRFIDPKNNNELANFDELQRWLPVDLYVGGTEHAVLHLLYARFWHKVLFDIGVVPTPEPFYKLRNQGMILGEDGAKMSKSAGNVVPVKGVLDEHGVDAFRTYEMFLGPFDATKPWNTKGIEGVKRFLNRAWKVFASAAGTAVAGASADEAAPADEAVPADDAVPTNEAFQAEVQTIVKGVTEEIAAFKFNTAISKLMVLTNKLSKMDRVPRAVAEILCKLMAPFAPMMTEEAWHTILGGSGSVHRSEWPQYDETMAALKVVTMAVQVNGRLRGTLEDMDPAEAADQEVVEARARVIDNVVRAIGDNEIAQTIFVPGRIVNFVTKSHR